MESKGSHQQASKARMTGRCGLSKRFKVRFFQWIGSFPVEISTRIIGISAPAPWFFPGPWRFGPRGAMECAGSWGVNLCGGKSIITSWENPYFGDTHITDHITSQCNLLLVCIYIYVYYSYKLVYMNSINQRNNIVIVIGVILHQLSYRLGPHIVWNYNLLLIFSKVHRRLAVPWAMAQGMQHDGSWNYDMALTAPKISEPGLGELILCVTICF